MSKIDLIMFLDDNKATNYYHQVIITAADVSSDVVFFQSPRKALSYFEELANGKNDKFPDVFFLDINMPEINGWEFLDAFANLILPKRPRIYMLTTSINPSDQLKTINNSLVTNMITKPLTEVFLEKLRKDLVGSQ